MKEKIIELLRFLNRLGRPPTLVEIWRGLGRGADFLSVWESLNQLKSGGVVAETEGFYWPAGLPANIRQRKLQDILFYKKFKRFRRLAGIFALIPFVDFVLLSGSMALGNVKPESDFDVIVGCRPRRIFTARFFAVFFFGLFKARRKNIDHKETARDKVCLNHFVTPKSYQLSPPYNIYWRTLYGNLTPVFGKKEDILNFFEANDWTASVELPERFGRIDFNGGKNFVKAALEFVLSGFLGGVFEKALKEFQIRRIERGLRTSLGYQPRFRYGDEELEFHPDTSRIKEFVSGV